MAWGAIEKFVAAVERALAIGFGALLLTGCILGVIAFISYRNSLRRELPRCAAASKQSRSPATALSPPASIRRIYSGVVH